MRLNSEKREISLIIDVNSIPLECSRVHFCTENFRWEKILEINQLMPDHLVEPPYQPHIMKIAFSCRTENFLEKTTVFKYGGGVGVGEIPTSRFIRPQRCYHLRVQGS